MKISLTLSLYRERLVFKSFEQSDLSDYPVGRPFGVAGMEHFMMFKVKAEM